MNFEFSSYLWIRSFGFFVFVCNFFIFGSTLNTFLLALFCSTFHSLKDFRQINIFDFLSSIDIHTDRTTSLSEPEFAPNDCEFHTSYIQYLV